MLKSLAVQEHEIYGNRAAAAPQVMYVFPQLPLGTPPNSTHDASVPISQKPLRRKTRDTRLCMTWNAPDVAGPGTDVLRRQLGSTPTQVNL